MNGRLTRKCLPHGIPSWVEDGAVFFITLNTMPRGKQQLTLGDTPQRIWESIVFNADRGAWWPHLVLLMPDHLHALISFAVDPGMREALSSWKHFVARQHGVQWQRDFFDHRLRRDESHVEKAHYIRQNPVRQGLVKLADEWPYVWTLSG